MILIFTKDHKLIDFHLAVNLTILFKKICSIILNINICILKRSCIGLAKEGGDSVKWIIKPTGEVIQYRVGGLWDS